MAAGQLSLTRRALLAGACAAPVAVTGGDRVFVQVSDDAERDRPWRLALDRFREVDALLAEAARTEDEHYYDRLGARHDSAVKRLLLTPAPDAAALAFKLDLLVAEQAWEMRGGELCMAALKRGCASPRSRLIGSMLRRLSRFAALRAQPLFVSREAAKARSRRWMADQSGMTSRATSSMDMAPSL